MSSQDEIKENYERTIIQFRDLVVKLQEDLVSAQVNRLDDDGSAQPRHQQMLDLNLQLLNTTQQVRAKALEVEMKKLDAIQATEHLEYIKVSLESEAGMNLIV